MNQIELMQSIAKYLARFSEQINILNSNNEFHINLHAENLLINVLNIVYDLNLKNLNYSESGNYPGIDLLDDTSSSKTSFQITSTNTIDKVKDCIIKYFRSSVYKNVEVLNIFILTNKQKSYSQESIQRTINNEIAVLKKKKLIKDKADIKFQFDAKINIIDKSDLYKKLNAENDLDKTIELERYIKKQFEIIEEKTELTNYYRSLKNMFYDIVMDDENGMTLNQIYTDPSFSVLQSAFSKDDPRFQNKEDRKFYDADPRYKVHEFVEDLLIGSNPLSLSKHYRLLLILGYPGQGKSSFCKKFLNNYVLNRKSDSKSVFYFQLRNVRQVREFIYNPLAVLYDEACSTTEQNLNKPLFNKSLLILDGLDELYMRENLKLDEIDRLCIELVRITEKHVDLQIILTSRYGYIDDEKLTKESILIIHLSPFNVKMQKEWLSKYKNYHPETWLTDIKIDSLNSEERFSHIKELLEQPLLLHMIASVKNEIDENTNRAKIYSDLFNELIERKYAREGQIEILKNIKKEDLRKLIREVAFAIFETGNEFITKIELLRLSATQSFLKLLPEENFRNSIKGIMISFYFKEIEKPQKDELDEDRSNYAIEFLHKSLREFMTAEKIYYTISENFLEKKMNGNYVIDDAKNALTILLSIFGKQDLSTELKFHLRQIVGNSTDTIRQELVERLCMFLPDFVSTDFLIEYRIDKDKYPIDISLRCFFGYWYFISCLGLRRNYLSTSFIQSRIEQYLRFLSTSNDHYITGFDLSNQDFSYGNLSKISFYNCSFENTDLSGSELDGSLLERCNLINTDFSKVYIDDVTFFNCVIKKSSFERSYLINVRFRNCKLSEVNFIKSRIDWIHLADYESRDKQEKIDMTINDCDFSEAKIDEDSLKAIRQWYPNIDNFLLSDNYNEEEAAPAQNKADTKDNNESPNHKRIII